MGQAPASVDRPESAPSAMSGQGLGELRSTCAIRVKTDQSAVKIRAEQMNLIHEPPILA